MSGGPDPTDGSVRAGHTRHWGLILAVAATVVAVDQLTKWWALHALRTHTIHVVWTLRLNLTRNTGAAFSMAGGRGALVGLAALAVVGVVVWQGAGVSGRLGAVAVGLVLGGALGNLVDRALRGGGGFMGGAVVDFIDFQWWPIFNVADSCVVVGALLLIFVTVIRPPAAASGGSEP